MYLKRTEQTFSLLDEWDRELHMRVQQGEATVNQELFNQIVHQRLQHSDKPLSVCFLNRTAFPNGRLCVKPRIATLAY